MPGARLTIDVNAPGLHALSRRVARMEDTTGMLDEIGAHLESSTLLRFETESGPDGLPWRPSRRAQREGGKTLTDRGRLRDSITRQVLGAGQRAEVQVGTNVEYGAIHQFGGTIRQRPRQQVLAFGARGGRFTSRRAASRRRAGFLRVAFASIGEREINMPARPFLGISAVDRTAIARIVLRHLERAGL